MKRLLFVCTGNICRSPTADGIARQVAQSRSLPIVIDSAGTHSYHIGKAPDPRAINAARKYGIDITSLRARKLVASDYHEFDLILAMDRGHLQWLKKLEPPASRAQIALFMDFASGIQSDVPDPYYGSHNDFQKVFSMLDKNMAVVIDKFLALQP